MTPIQICSQAPALPGSQVTRSRGLASRDRLWQTGQTITVGFLDCAPALCEKIFNTALIWTQYANIKFELVKYSTFKQRVDSQIRVSLERGGSWSYVGTDALLADILAPTMQLGWLTENTPEDEIQRVVLHEFGHALGLLHEHQHPAGGIPWNREKVIDYYRKTNGWTAWETTSNVLNRADENDMQVTQFDTESIMLYAVPAALTTNGYSTGWNRELSAGDKSIIAQLYPRQQITIC